jgi:hypothetical protein
MVVRDRGGQREQLTVDVGPLGRGPDALPVFEPLQVAEADVLRGSQVIAHVVLEDRADPLP